MNRNDEILKEARNEYAKFGCVNTLTIVHALNKRHTYKFSLPEVEQFLEEDGFKARSRYIWDVNGAGKFYREKKKCEKK